MVLCALSCTPKEKPATSTMKGVFYATLSGADQTLELLPGKSKTLDLRALAQEVSDTYLTMSFKVDAEAVQSFNSARALDCELLPSGAYEFVNNSVMLPRYNKQSSTAKLKITASGLEDNKLYVLPVSIDKVTGTDNWALASEPLAYVTVMQVNTGPEGGDGSPEYPYVLATPEDMTKMRDRLSPGEKVYFRMTADIDLSGINWEPLNYASPYDLGIDFDGAGHTISNLYSDFASYPSFFGVLNGSCRDVTFTNAKITVLDARAGILAGYCGTGDIRGEAERVHIQGELDHTASTKYGAGGFFGYLANGRVFACSADVVIKSKLNNVGGIFGYCGRKAIVEDCWTTGTIVGGQRVGGIGGGTDGKDLDEAEGIQILDCYSTATVRGSFALGGIGGFFNMANTNAGTPLENAPGNHIERCIAWNGEITANWNQNDETGKIISGDVSHYSDGAIIGYTAVKNYLSACYRSPQMVYNQSIFFDYTDVFSLYDQPDASPAAPLMIPNVEGAEHNYPYHGKTAPEGSSLSDVALMLGWNESVWDLSGSTPVIRPDATLSPIEDVSTGGGIGDYDENKIH